MAKRKLKLTIQYDGSGYHGWAFQPELKTIQGELAAALENIFGRRLRITAASRTDAGVSALGQVAAMEVESPIPTESIAKVISDKLPLDISVSWAEEAGPRFDVIGGAKRKLYRYTIFTGEVRPVLHVRHCWHVPSRLDIKAMNEAGRMLTGTRDFKSFASAKDHRQDSVRTLYRCQVYPDDKWIYVEAEGNAFLYNMVRNIVGTLIEVGLSRIDADKIEQILNAADRKAAGPIAPPQGLCLMWVKY